MFCVLYARKKEKQALINNNKYFVRTSQNQHLENRVDSMNHPIAGNNVKEDNISASSTGVDLDEFVPGGCDVLPRGSLEGGGARGDILSLHTGPRHNVPQENVLKSLLV